MKYDFGEVQTSIDHSPGQFLESLTKSNNGSKLAKNPPKNAETKHIQAIKMPSCSPPHIAMLPSFHLSYTNHLHFHWLFTCTLNSSPIPLLATLNSMFFYLIHFTPKP